MLTLSLLALAAWQSSGFQRPPGRSLLQKQPSNGLTHNIIAPQSRAGRLTSLAAAEVQRATMDERIFSFNKVVIDSVYDIICAERAESKH